jgi:uncharacterized membrane protein
MSLKDNLLEFLKIDELKANFLKLIEAKFELKKIELIEKIKPSLIAIIWLFIGVILSILCYVFVLIFMGLLIVHFTGSYLLTFGILAIIHVIFLLLFKNYEKQTKAVIDKKIDDSLKKLM